MEKDKRILKLEDTALEVRKNLLKLCHRAGNLHIGGDFSVTEMMVALWFDKLKYDHTNPRMSDRDRFFLSKGHSAGILYVVQAMLGYYPLEEVFATYNRLDSRFGLHPSDLHLETIEISSGSLGHGLAIAVGSAITCKQERRPNRVYCVMGDGEIQEGSVWEAAMAASHYQVGNLVGIVDRNGLSLDGPTETLMALEPLADKWRAFGWNVVEIDGNDMEQVVQALDALPPVDSNVPTMILSKTVKGKGISYMENDPAWHAGSVDDKGLEEGLLELEKNYRGGNE